MVSKALERARSSGEHVLIGEEMSEDPAPGIPTAEEDSGKKAKKERPRRQELRVPEVKSRKDFKSRGTIHEDQE